MSRLLMNYVLLKNNLPPVIIKTTDKKNYLFALSQANTGNLEAFAEYVAEQLIWGLEISVKAAKGEDVEERNDWEKELFLFKNDSTLKQKFTAQLSNEIKNEIYYPIIQKPVDKPSSFDDLFLTKALFLK